MKRLFLIIVLAIACSHHSHAQFGNLMKKVKDKAKQRADRKTDQAIDKSLDKVEETGKSATTAKPKNQKDTVPETTTTTVAAPVPATAAAGSGLKDFSKYDFVPGEQVVYFDNFDNESLAELPQGWNTNGSGEIVKLDKFPGQWLRVHGPFNYLSRNTKEFTENYTVEFDVILQLKNNGWMFPEFRVGLLASNGENTTDNGFLNEYKKYTATLATLYPAENKGTRAKLNTWLDNKEYFKSDVKSFAALEQWYGQPAHVAIQVQKERLRMWVNAEKLFDVPKGIPANYVMNQLFFQVSQTNYSDAQYAIYVGNIKVAIGKPDTRHKLLDEGKFSTTGILFDVNASTIKPESYGVLKEIADVLKSNEDIRVKIVGHTDSDGKDAANMDLSKKRAAAVKTALSTEFGIDESRMDTDGKGETMPVADNKTKEGKSQNRRVEFIKL